jgi:hypothetical protein
MKRAWENYRDTVHRGVSPEKIEAVQMAFYAGAYAFYGESMKALEVGGGVSGDEMRSYGALVAEVEDYCSGVAAKCSGQTN